jgi:hypothetical protein
MAATKGASICGAIKFSIPTIIASAIRHVATDHVCIPTIVASAVSHIATDHVCIPTILASAVSHIHNDHVCIPIINVGAARVVVMIVVDVDNGRTLLSHPSKLSVERIAS